MPNEADFYIERVDDSLQSNFYVFLGDAQEYTKRFPPQPIFWKVI